MAENSQTSNNVVDFAAYRKAKENKKKEEDFPFMDFYDMWAWKHMTVTEEIYQDAMRTGRITTYEMPYSIVINPPEVKDP